MPPDGLALSVLGAAALVAVTHTILGPDHYVPLVMLARARRWSAWRTAVVTAACGAGHVAASILLSLIALWMGMAASRLEGWERARGGLAAWGLIAFGLAYAAYGIRHGIRRSRGLEAHSHGGHVHAHTGSTHPHEHGRQAPRGDTVTFWSLFLVFILGPCEPLLPLVLLPASRGRAGLALAAGLLFGALTIASMVGLTLAGLSGFRRVSAPSLERWSHALAGAAVASSGAAVVVLGL